ncbi:MAG: prepilin-type N-terminal cleavage/methylation domain-containing protein [Thermoanaerobaculia bacterium]|nr:prepilin-type N-terminal cleavage/methylation domain-containing protein [Thermoanaerobaculia bacterium]
MNQDLPHRLPLRRSALRRVRAAMRYRRLVTRLPTSRTSSRGRLEGRRPASGFTLLEVLVLLAIIGLVAAFMYPAVLITLSKAQLESTVQETASIFYAARRNAVQKASPATVSFNVADSEIEGRIASRIDGDPNDQWYFLKILPERVDFEGPPLDSAAIVGFGGGHSVEFRDNGSIDNTGAVRFSRFVGGGKRYFEVRIEPAASPRIVISRWDDDAGDWVEEGDN